MNEFIKTLANDTCYDYIANNYHRMDKSELADIIKELLYAIYSNCTDSEYKQILKEVMEELIDRQTMWG